MLVMWTRSEKEEKNGSLKTYENILKLNDLYLLIENVS